MAGVSPRCSPVELATQLAELEVRVEHAVVELHAVPLPDYPDGPRPSSVVRLSGGAFFGSGENVAFYLSEHERFASFVQTWFRASGARTGQVGSLLGRAGTLYERAALEAALIDLALRQAGLSLHDLTQVREAALRFVVSLSASTEPQKSIAELRAAGYAGELKLDVDPSWSSATLAELARDRRIAIFDFKNRGELEMARQLAALASRALLEDPPSGFDFDPHLNGARVSRDASLCDAKAVASAVVRGEAVNLKAPRMGGPLELLRGLEHALASHQADGPQANVAAYIGGMFEVGVGRAQARQLAALYCAGAPNDLAPNRACRDGIHHDRAHSPALIRLDTRGFGDE